MKVHVVTITRNDPANRPEESSTTRVFDSFKNAVAYTLSIVKADRCASNMTYGRGTMKEVKQELKQGSYSLYIYDGICPDVYYRIQELPVWGRKEY